MQKMGYKMEMSKIRYGVLDLAHFFVDMGKDSGVFLCRSQEPLLKLSQKAYKPDMEEICA